MGYSSYVAARLCDQAGRSAVTAVSVPQSWHWVPAYRRRVMTLSR